MNASDNLDLFKSIASDLQVNEAFIEKDQYAMRLMADLAEISNPKIQLVFAGGTSLSKAHGLIERFSEDLDFKVSLKGEVTRGERRNFRKQVIETINQNEWLKVDPESVKSCDSSRFFQLQVSYPKVFPLPKELRSNIKLEVTFEEPALSPENRSLTSFVSQARGEGPEAQSIPCISPVETAADKISALTWRVLDRDRTQPNDDATLVRHLYDLAALKKTVETSNQFEGMAIQNLEQDASRSKKPGIEQMTPMERVQDMLQILKTDPLYRDEYSSFVTLLSYASDLERPTFETAVSELEDLVKQLEHQSIISPLSLNKAVTDEVTIAAGEQVVVPLEPAVKDSAPRPEPGSREDVLDAARYIAKEVGDFEGSGQRCCETDTFKIEIDRNDVTVWDSQGDKVIEIPHQSGQDLYQPSTELANLLTSVANEIEQENLEREAEQGEQLEVDEGFGIDDE